MAKKIGMMQPYLFPYLGYFQLIAAVDEFVLGDDLQYVKEAWINRNRILVNGKPKLITFPLRKGSHLDKINERVLCDEFPYEAEKILRVISAAYGKAPQYDTAIALIADILRHPDRNLARYAENATRRICDYLGIRTPIHIASDLKIIDVIDKQDRVIRTARKIGGETYINFIGGVRLYDPDRFREAGLTLKFHRIDDIVYRQFDDEFVPLLSIIDVMMFNSVAEIREMLPRFSLIDAADLAEAKEAGAKAFYDACALAQAEG
ncbi:WbqC family protein [Noviherbaspirillum sp. ST9]|uniref:WbqC family protein n=1 Tax=Noviherbaspirillum sp. ST9 TaxID=3401606 RepID=UPI003B58A144